MDLQYINEMSVWTDKKFLFSAVRAVLNKGGAV